MHCFLFKVSQSGDSEVCCFRPRRSVPRKLGSSFCKVKLTVLDSNEPAKKCYAITLFCWLVAIQDSAAMPEPASMCAPHDLHSFRPVCAEPAHAATGRCIGWKCRSVRIELTIESVTLPKDGVDLGCRVSVQKVGPQVQG